MNNATAALHANETPAGTGCLMITVIGAAVLITMAVLFAVLL